MKIDRQKVYDRLNGHCGYCGKEFKTIKDMQVDHMFPLCSNHPNIHSFDNLMPSCKRCNHYKRAATVENFREMMKTLHKRIEQNYINRVAIDFGVIKLKPFDGLFYFEKNHNIKIN